MLRKSSRQQRAVMPQRIANGDRKPGRATPTEASFLRTSSRMGQIDKPLQAPYVLFTQYLVGVTLSPHLISRSSWLAGLLVLLLLGCGGHAVVTGTNPSSPSVGFTATPPLEGTGPASTSPGGGGGGGGAAVYVPGLPIGNNNPSEEDINNGECAAFQWLGATIPSGVTVTITSVVVVQGDFTTVSAAAAGCTGAVCLGFQFNAADTSQDTNCYVAVQYTGSLPIPTPPVYGYVRFDGELSCPNTDSATCQQYSSEMTPTPQATFTYYGPTPPGSGSPGSGSP